MKTRTLSLFAVTVCALGAYGVGWWVGRQANQALQPGPAAETSVELNSTLPTAMVNSGADISQGNAAPDRSAFLTGSNTPLQVVEAKLQALNGSGKGPFGTSGEDDTWVPVLFLLSTNDYPKVWGRLKDTPFAWRLLTAWSQKDPRGALAAVLALPEGFDRTSRISDVLRSWAASEPDACVAWIRQLPEGERRDLISAKVMTTLARQSPTIATRLLQEIPPGAFRQEAVCQFVSGCWDTHPEAAAPLAATERDAFQRQGLFRPVARGWAEKNAAEALAWARNLGSPTDRDNALAGVLEGMGRSRPEEAVQMLLSQIDPKIRGQMAQAVARGWAETDLTSAANWASKLPEDSLRQQAWEGMRRQWMMQDPEGAASFVTSSLPAGKTRIDALESLGHEWTGLGWDERAGVQWAHQLSPGSEREAFLSGLRQPRWAEGGGR